jgi:SAM-dependent methyltransferase
VSAIQRAIVGQFGHPRGILGAVAGLIMRLRPSNRARNARTLELLEIGPDDHVLEVGFGPGVAAGRAAAVATRGKVVGIDRSPLMVRQARRRNAPAIREGRLELLLGDVDRLPPLPTRFDKVFAVNVYAFWSDPVAVLRGLRGVMRPGGTIALTFQPRRPGATAEDTRRGAERMASSLRDAGFAEVRVELLPMAPVDAACVLARAGGAQDTPPRR